MKKDKDVILILNKSFSEEGGVTNYYKIFFRKFRDIRFELKYFIIGSRSENSTSKKEISYIYYYLKDLFKFLLLLIKDKKIKIIQINPSLIPIPLIRDAIFLYFSVIFRKKIITFFHGWKQEIKVAIDMNNLFKKILRWTYSKSSKIIVLAKDFKKDLIEWGFKKEKIIVSKMMFDRSNFKLKLYSRENNIPWLLYLGRIQNIKGIFEIIQALSIIKKDGYQFKMIFAGNPVDRDTIKNLKLHVKELGIDDFCHFENYVSGTKKEKILNEADIFVFPSYTEGCPTSVLEAMASGLFIISTDVGALREIIQDKRNGFLVKVRDPLDLAEKLKIALNDLKLVRKIGANNRKEALRQYEADLIIGQIKEIYNELI